MALLTRPDKELLKKEDVIQALVIAENFDNTFGSLTEDTSAVLLPLVNYPILDYSLEFLHAAGVQVIILFCCTHADEIKEFIKGSRWSSPGIKMQIKVCVSENCQSLGDVLRDVYDKRLINDDFILLTGDVVSNMQLKPLLIAHKERRKKEKQAVMTAVYKRATPGHQTLSINESCLMVFNKETNRMLHYQLLKKNKTLSIPLNILLENKNVRVCRDLLDCHVNICSPDVLSLFADNYDYQSMSDFLRGILENEEILGNTFYLHLLDGEYAASVCDLQLYSAVSHDIINRWVFPVVPDLFSRDTKEFYYYLRHNIYKQKDVTLARSCKLVKDVVIGNGTTIGENTTVLNSVIGRNCLIGENVILKSAFIWDNVQVQSGCNVEMSILANDVILSEGTSVINSILPSKYFLEKNSQVSDKFLTNEDENDDDHNEVFSPWQLLESADEYESSESEFDNGEASDQENVHMDDANLFYHEVLDTLIRGIEEKLKCDNLILEINSLKYAYNMTVSEVNHVVIKSILEIPNKIHKHATTSKEILSHIKQIMTQFLQLLKNYIKNEDAQMDALNALKEYAVFNDTFTTVFLNIMHFLYDNDILQEDVIFKWYNSLTVNDNFEKSLQQQVYPFIKWLNEAEEEDDSD